MVPPSSTSYLLLDTLADSVNPLLAFLAILIALRESRDSSRRGFAFTVATGLALAGIYAVRFLNAAFSVSQQWGGRYSTHSAFATSVVISSAFWCLRRRYALLAVLGAYLILVVIMGYHSVTDVLISSAVACVVTAPCQIVALKLAPQQGAEDR